MVFLLFGTVVSSLVGFIQQLFFCPNFRVKFGPAAVRGAEAHEDSKSRSSVERDALNRANFIIQSVLEVVSLLTKYMYCSVLSVTTSVCHSYTEKLVDGVPPLPRLLFPEQCSQYTNQTRTADGIETGVLQISDFQLVG